MDDIMKIVNSTEDSGLLIRDVENEAKAQKGGFLSILLGILGACLLGNMLAGKEVTNTSAWTIRAGQGF